jgi:hypothetical protein
MELLFLLIYGLKMNLTIAIQLKNALGLGLATKKPKNTLEFMILLVTQMP